MADFGRTLNAATPGLGRLALAIGGGGGPAGAYQKAYDGELSLQSKLAQAMAAIEAHQSTADLNRVKARGEEAEQAGRTPEAVQRVAMLSSGIPLDEAPNVDNYLRTGELGGKYRPLPEGLPGPTVPAPDWQGKLGEVARAVALTQRALALGDKSSENVAKAGSIERGDRLSDSIIAGTGNRNTIAGAQAAAGGKPLYHTDTSGAVLDQFTGGLDTSNPMAGSTIALRGAQAGNQKAGAAAHYASAGAANALAEQRRQITANGPGPGKVPVGYRYTQGPDGEARLEPIPGGPKDPNAQTGKPLPASAAKGYLDNLQNLDRAQKALDLLEGKSVGDATGDPEATGLKGYLPNVLLNRVDPAGVDTRAAIADLGSLVIHDRSGAAVTAAEMPRLAPFIPSANDDAVTAKKKTKLFVQNYKALVDDSAEFYKSSGYNVPALTRKQPAAVAPRGGAAPPAKAQAVPAAGFTYLGKE
jgi:hypothetical protein